MREWTNFTRHELDRLKVVIAELRQQLEQIGNTDGESIVDLLSLGYVYKLDGSTDRGGNEILVLPRDVDLSQPDFVRLVNYIQKRRQTKLLVLVDRRQSTWFSVKKCLKLLNETLSETNLNVKDILVMRPSGFQAVLSEASFRLTEYGNIHVKIITSEEQLTEWIHSIDLPKQFGGNAPFHYEHYMKLAITFDRFSRKTQRVAKKVVKYTAKIEATEMPNDENQCLLEKERQNFEFLIIMDELLDSINFGDTIVDRYRERYTRKYVANVNLMLERLKQLNASFSDLWQAHGNRMEAAVKLRSFESGYKNLVSALLAHASLLSSDQYGNGSSWILQLIADHAKYHAESREIICRSQELFHFGQSISTFGSDSVVPKCRYLETIICQINDSTKQRQERLTSSLEVAQQIEQAQKWWEEASTLLCSNADNELNLTHMELMIQKSTNLTIFEETRSSFTRSQYGDKISEMRQKVKDLNEQYKRRTSHIKRDLEPKPIQHVEPRLADQKLDYPNGGLSDREEDGINERLVCIPKEVTSSDMSEEEKPRIRNALSSSQSSLSADEQDNTKIDHIIRELITTEILYIKELGQILTGYCDEINNNVSCPEVIRGNSGVIFGNLEEIYAFHHNIWLPALEKAKSSLDEIGRVFLEYADHFNMYSTYCRHSKKSGEIRQQLEKSEFFQTCQNRLNHALPLSAYLLKPIQRLTKYQLLIGQLVKYGEKQHTNCDTLKEALEVMLKCLQSVNDSLKNITGYDKLLMVGRLIFHGPVEVETKRNRVRVSMRNISRYMFLYEKSLVLCKKQENTGDYVFKVELPLDGLQIDDEKTKQNRFCLRSATEQRQLNICTSSKEIKMSWIREIKRSIISLQSTPIQEEYRFRRTVSEPVA